MKYRDLIFDLYGTLVDIHTEEDDLVWEKTALYFGFYGAHYTPTELRSAFTAAMAARPLPGGWPDSRFVPNSSKKSTKKFSNTTKSR